MPWVIRLRWPLLVVFVASLAWFYGRHTGQRSRDAEVLALTNGVAACAQESTTLARLAAERAATARKTVIRYRTVYRDRKAAVEAVLAKPRAGDDESVAANLLRDYHAESVRLRDPAGTAAGADPVR